MKRQVIIIWGILILISITSCSREKATPNFIPRILVVTAHPDDEAGVAGTIYKTTTYLEGIADLAVITNGEGGFKYSTLAERIYGLELTEEETGRKHLPAIRKQELKNAGKIIGLRNIYFMDQKDRRYTQDPGDIDGVWDIEGVKKKLADIIMKEKYDFVFTGLVRPGTHGHHVRATVMALEVVKELEPDQRPLILGARGSVKPDTAAIKYDGYPGYPITKVKADAPVFKFDRTQPFSYKDRLNYKIIVNWLIAEHKSQGTMQLGMGRVGDIENFLVYEINGNKPLQKAEKLFEALKGKQFKTKEYK